VLFNGTLHTVDEKLPSAQAVAIRGNRIIAVGGDEAIRSWIGPGTVVYDLQGKLVLPGFNDCHTHFMPIVARFATAFDLFGAGDDLEEIQRRLVQYAKDHPEMDWLMGFRWQPRLREGEWPTRADLDAVEEERPVAILDQELHTAWVNTPALRAIGYDQNTPDPEGGVILRDPSGQPTGILFELAYDPIVRELSLPYPDFLDVVTQEVDVLNRMGLTSISDNANPDRHLEYLRRMTNEGKLNLRVNHWPGVEGGLEAAIQLRERYRSNDYIQVVGVKIYMDGVFSNRSAWLLESYSDAPNKYGYSVMDLDEYTELVYAFDASGFQVITHAIGDRGVREVLNAYENAGKINGRRDSRHRIEHVELVHPDDQERFTQLNVIPSMTPLHSGTSDPEYYLTDRIGTVRETNAYLWRKLVDAGAHLCFGTDWPCIKIDHPDPLKQIFTAVTRRPPEDPDLAPWHPEQALTVEEAIRCYTLEPAYAEFQEDRKGSITPGKVADLCVLDKNILEGDPRRILETEVVMTVFDGEIVQDAM
jgi:hypothetical protein